MTAKYRPSLENKYHLQVRDLASFSHLGIPHFQRGLVWNKDAIALLLESLYKNTPLGSIVVWKPENPDAEGIPLPGSQNPTYFIIDGQQRTRSIRSVLAGLPLELPVNDDSEENNHKDEDVDNEENKSTENSSPQVWCVNLTRISDLDNMITNKLSDHPLFMHVLPPDHEDARFRKNIIPLEKLQRLAQELHANSDKFTKLWNEDVSYFKECIELDESQSGSAENVLEVIKTNIIFKIAEMWERNLPVRVLGPEFDLAEVVQVYNRINSGGRSVEAEEKAYATLVSLHPESAAKVKDLFAKLHPETNHSKGRGPSRDDALKRKKEKSFGFKLFLRIFLHVCNYHAGYTIGNSSVSLTAISNHNIQSILRDDPDKTNQLWAITSQIIEFVRLDILEEGLHCDDLRFCPDATSLTPVFQVLLRFPQLMNDDHIAKSCRNSLLSFALRLYLADFPGRKIFELCEKIRRTNTFDECLEIMKEPRVGDIELNKKLANAQSMQSRYVLLLYWLQRRLGAKDLSYNNKNEQQRQVRDSVISSLNDGGLHTSQEIEIHASCSPEKQHLVPYSALKEAFNLKGARVGTHEINSIGNITYISSALNSYESGLGSKPADLGLEDDMQRRAHFLSEKSIEVYNITLQNLDTESIVRENFRQFCRYRTELVLNEFIKWVNDLSELSFSTQRIEPSPLILKRANDDIIRSLDYDDALEDAILEFLNRPGISLEEYQWRDTAKLVLRTVKQSRVIGAKLAFSRDGIGIDLYNPAENLKEKIVSYLHEAKTIKVETLDKAPFIKTLNETNNTNSIWIPLDDSGHKAALSVIRLLTNANIENQRVA